MHKFLIFEFPLVFNSSGEVKDALRTRSDGIDFRLTITLSHKKVTLLCNGAAFQSFLQTQPSFG
jgi:hypothetical protein